MQRSIVTEKLLKRNVRAKKTHYTANLRSQARKLAHLESKIMKRKLTNEEFKRFIQFSNSMILIQAQFPEHELEINRCVYEVGQKIPCCENQNCECQISFEEFHQKSKNSNQK